MWIWLYLGSCLVIGTICTIVICVVRYRDRHMIKGIEKYLLKNMNKQQDTGLV